jgi:hypothetical protein
MGPLGKGQQFEASFATGRRLGKGPGGILAHKHRRRHGCRRRSTPADRR